MVQKAGAGGTVLLIADAGAYNMGAKSVYISHGGTDGQPVTIKGVDSSGNDMAAQFVGNRAMDASAATKTGSQLFVIRDEASNITISNVDIKNVSSAFRVSSDVSNIEIGNVKAHNVRFFFEDRAADSDPTKTATINGLYVHDVSVTGYSRSVFALKYDTHNVRIEDVVGDSAGQSFESFAMGVHLDHTVHDVVFERVSMLNNQNFTGSYLNGDGFATEGSTHHITFIDTLAAGSTDGGYDLKSDYTTLVRATASDNGRNFRIWGNNNVMVDSVGVDPHSRAGGTGSQVWMSGGADIAISGSQFVDSGSNTKVFNFDASALITLNDVRVTYAMGAIMKAGSGRLNGVQSDLVATTPATGAFSSGSVPTLINHPLTGTVSISGDAHQGALLNVQHSLADWNGISSVSYQWLRDGKAITGATSTSYELTQSDVGASITVAVLVVDGRGNAGMLAGAGNLQIVNVNDAPSGQVLVQGDIAEGAQLTALSSLHDEDGLGVITYQWLRDGEIISGAESQSLTLSQADVGHAISVLATYTDAFGTSEFVLSQLSDAVQNVNNVATGAITISGDASVGQSLAAAHTIVDADGIGTLHYQWMRGSEAISGAGAPNYTITGADAGHSISVKISFVDGYGALESLTSPASLIPARAPLSLMPTGALLSTNANETLIGTSARDVFVFDTASGATFGIDGIKSFGAGDRIVTTTALVDPNADGIIKANSSDRFILPAMSDTGSTSGFFKVATTTGSVLTSLSLLGTETHNGSTFFVYARKDDALASSNLIFADDSASAHTPIIGPVLAPGTVISVPPDEGAHVARTTINGSSASNDTLRGTLFLDAFFFDTDAKDKVGSDTIKNFAFGDWVVTTSELLDPNGDGVIRANNSDRFDLVDNGISTGSLKVFADSGKAMSSLDFYGTFNDGEQDFFVYGQHSTTPVVPELWF